MRGDLDLQFHQSISPLSEGNLVDLDLGVLGVSPLLFFHSYFLKHLLLCWNLRVKDLSTSCVLAIAFCCIGLLSPREFVELKVCELVTLGSLDPRRCS